MVYDPSAVKQLPPVKYLDEAARAYGYLEWFAVPTFFKTPTNQRIIADAHVLERGGHYT